MVSVSRPNEMIGGTLSLTVMVAALDLIAPLVAEMVVAPAATPVTTPAALTEAIAGLTDAKVNAPPGGNGKLLASSLLGFATALPVGATVDALSTRLMDVITCCTLSVAAPVTPCAVARTLVSPFARARARLVCVPLESRSATDGLDDTHAKSMPLITTSSVS